MSREAESGIAPARETRPQVGFRPVTPQIDAGSLIEPPVSEPSAAKVARDATAAPEPEEEPPVMCAGFQGLRTWPVWSLWPVGLKANSAMFSAPTCTEPAASRRARAVEVTVGRWPRRSFAPHSESSPAR